MITGKVFSINLKVNIMGPLTSLLFSTKALMPKALILMSSLMFYLQTQISNIEFWEKMANISIALFVLMIGIFVLFKEYQKSKNYTKELNERIIDMTDKASSLAESSTRAVENSTKAIQNMTAALERMIDKLDKLDNN